MLGCRYEDVQARKCEIRFIIMVTSLLKNRYRLPLKAHIFLKASLFKSWDDTLYKRISPTLSVIKKDELISLRVL